MWWRKTTDLFLWALMQRVWTEHLLRLTPKALVEPCIDGSRHPPHAGQKANRCCFSVWVAFPMWRDMQHIVSLRTSATGYRLLFQKCQNFVYQPLHIKHICYRAIGASPQGTGKELACIESGLQMHFASNNKSYYNPSFPTDPLKKISLKLWLKC